VAKYIFRDLEGHILWESSSENIATGRDKMLSDDTKKKITNGFVKAAKIFGYEPIGEEMENHSLT